MATSNMTSLIDLAKTNQIAPVTQDFDESKGVAGRVQSITSKASPLMQTARTRAAQNSASRGLLNSSIGAQAGEQAVIETATPIANADANLFQQQSLTNQAAKNAANTQNANNTINAGTSGAQLDVNERQAEATRAEQARQFGVSSGQQQQQIDAQREQFAQQLGMTQQDMDLRRNQLTQQQQQFLADLDQRKAQLTEQGRQFDTSRTDNLSMFDREIAQKAEQFGLTQTQQMALAQLDVDTKLKMADLEAQYKNDIQSSTNIANAWGTTMQGISAIQTDPNLDEATKRVLIENNLASFGSFSNFWKKATGGTADVSDLLNFGVATAPDPQVDTGPISGGPAGAPPGGAGGYRGSQYEFDNNNNG